MTANQVATRVAFAVLLTSTGTYQARLAQARRVRLHAARTAALPADEREMAGLVQAWLAARQPTVCPPRYVDYAELD